MHKNGRNTEASATSDTSVPEALIPETNSPTAALQGAVSIETDPVIVDLEQAWARPLSYSCSIEETEQCKREGPACQVQEATRGHETSREASSEQQQDHQLLQSQTPSSQQPDADPPDPEETWLIIGPSPSLLTYPSGKSIIIRQACIRRGISTATADIMTQSSQRKNSTVLNSRSSGTSARN
nr:PREDICTED: uncharacterized protein LOC105271727 [Fopius arisanus]